MGNSVIYRPAYDAEVEYLESTGTQWIDTGIVPTSDTSFEIEFQQVSFTYKYSPVAHCGEYYNSNDTFGFCIFNYTSTNGIASYYGTFSNIYVGNNFINIGDRLNVKYRRGNTNIVLTNKSLGITDSNSLDTTFTNGSRTLYILYGNTKTDDLRHPSAMKLYFCKIYNGSTLIRDFIPVRIGSTGYMYDKVSKQLFANKGTGNFILGNDVSNAVIPQQRCVLYFGNQRSVGFERIYEEYEWLCGRNGAYINTNHKLHTCYDVFDCHFKWDGAINNPDGSALGVFGCHFYKNGDIWGRAAINYGRFFINYFKLVNWDTVLVNEVYEVDLKSFMSSISTEKYSYILNGTYHEFSNNGLQEMVSNADVVLFENMPDNGSYFHGDIASFRIYHDNTDFVNMTPCKLLQPIPAILDGNGIARQAGECGMWDKVSNKFYGNVANSGTFTVKGPKCYEEYKWLKAEIPIGAAMMSLPINSSTFNCTIEHTGARANLPHLYSDGYIYYTESSNMDMIAVWNISEENTPFSASVGSLMIIESNEEYFKVNNIRITKYGFPILGMVIKSSYNSNNATTTKTSKITVDGSVRYVPCKLTHGIPASMDANGIARPAGTCGMWDKVNDKFYGNVANSGSFTVSND